MHQIFKNKYNMEDKQGIILVDFKDRVRETGN